MKEIAIFGAGFVVGALGASYVIGWHEEEEMKRRIEQKEANCPEAPRKKVSPLRRMLWNRSIFPARAALSGGRLFPRMKSGMPCS